MLQKWGREKKKPKPPLFYNNILGSFFVSKTFVDLLKSVQIL